MPPPDVSIVIPAFNKWNYTFACLMSVLEQTRDVAHEVIVVDNASSDETPLALPRLPGVRHHRNAENLGFARACNQGAALARGRHLLFLNNDTVARPGWLRPMVDWLERDPAVAVVGSKLLYPDGTIQHAGVAVAYAQPLPIMPHHVLHRRPAGDSTEARDCAAVTAACMLVRREVFERLGGFDEGYVNGYEDVDLCFRVGELGLRIVYEPRSVLVHHESVSDGRFRHAPHNEDLLNRRWMGRFRRFDVDRRRDDRPRPPRPGRPPLSVVVPARDALRTLAPALEDLGLQLGAEDELLVADAGSSDCTCELASLFAAAHPGLVRVLRSPTAGGIEQAVAAGLAEARGALTLLLPAHLRTDPGFLDQASTLVSRSRPVVVLPLSEAGAGPGGAVVGQTDALRADAAAAASALLSGRPIAAPAAGSLARAGEAPLFSVMVPCFNQARYLGEALESLLAQTEPRWEAVVVDDGSTDETPAVIAEYARRDPRIRGFSKPNGGVASALNRAAREARADWLCWLSSDDLFLPGKLAAHLEALRADPGVRFMHTDFYLLREESGAVQPSGIQPGYVPPPELQVLTLLRYNYFNGITVALHREVVEAVGLFDEAYRYGQDFDLWLRASARFRSRFLPTATAVTRLHPGQGTATFCEAGIFDSGRAIVGFLQRHGFAALFPAMDLTRADGALRALALAVEAAHEPSSYVARCGAAPALLARAAEWLAAARDDVRATVQHQLRSAAPGLPDAAVRAAVESVASAQAGFRYAGHDARALMVEQARRVAARGESAELQALERYLRMIDDGRTGLLERRAG